MTESFIITTTQCISTNVGPGNASAARLATCRFRRSRPVVNRGLHLRLARQPTVVTQLLKDADRETCNCGRADELSQRSTLSIFLASKNEADNIFTKPYSYFDDG